MILLIDAYNVLKQISAAQYINEAQRNAFVRKLEKYSLAKGNTVIVVFDGGTESRPLDSMHGSVRVIYSGYRMNADDVLKRLCVEFKHRATVALVSSDRELCSFAYHHGVTCVDADLLDTVLRKAAEAPALQMIKGYDKAHKREGYESSSEIDQLMQEATKNVMIKQEDGIAEQRGGKKTLSKVEKKIKKVVNKL